jgi:hypothetical protein
VLQWGAACQFKELLLRPAVPVQAPPKGQSSNPSALGSLAQSQRHCSCRPSCHV